MTTHGPDQVQPVRLPTSNYAFRCDVCRLFIELHSFLPKWRDLFTGAVSGVGFPQWGIGREPTPAANSDTIHCPHCDALSDCVELVDGEAPDAPGNYVTTSSPALHWLRRVRECQNCGARFKTAELDEGHVGELERLRELETTLTRHVASCTAKVRASAASLEQVAGFLEQLLAPEADAPVDGDEVF